VSSNGSQWTTIGNTTVGGTGSGFIGLPVTSQTTATLAAATFDQVVVAAAATAPVNGLPSPWQTLDIGAVGLPGSALYAAGQFTLKGAGANIWGAADAFRYVYQPFSGDGPDRGPRQRD